MKILIRALLCAWLLQLVACSSTAPAIDQRKGLQLVSAINHYRLEQGLSAIPVSPSLMAVAQTHIADLRAHNPVYSACNLHSWSEHGSWSSCCYRAEATQPQCMWNKPREITGGAYSGKGFEIAAYSSGTLTIDKALLQWQGSAEHHDVILNRAIWSLASWRAIGAAISDNFAVVWFGELADPHMDAVVEQ